MVLMSGLEIRWIDRLHHYCGVIDHLHVEELTASLMDLTPLVPLS